MKVSRLPIDPGPAAWADLLPPAAPAQKLEGAQTADWLVIGGGFAGLSALARLKQLHPANKIILLEASRIAKGPAGRNSGFMIDLPHDLASEDYGGGVRHRRPTPDRSQSRRHCLCPRDGRSICAAPRGL